MPMSFYTAGKVWNAEKFQFLRDNMMLPVRARWIDLASDHPIVTGNKPLLWQMCYEDVRDSNFVFLYSDSEDEEQRGALVEVGMAYGLNKRVYAFGYSKSLRADAVSDVAFTHHHLWTWLDADNIVKAAYQAMALEIQHIKKERAAHAC